MEFKELKNILKRLYNEHIRYHLKRIILCLVLSVCIAGSTSAIAWLLDPAVKKIFIDKNQTYAWLIPLGIIITFSVKGLSLYFSRLNMSIVGQTISGELQKKIAKSILFSDVQTLDSRHSGRYISNIQFDAGQVSHLVSVGILNLMKDSLSVVFLVGLMFYQNWKLAAFAIFMIPLAGGLAKNLGKKVGKATTQASQLSGNLVSFLTDILRGSRMIRIFQKENQENSNADNVITDLLKKNIRVAEIMIRATPIMEALTGFMIAGFIFFSGKLINSGELELNNFFSFLAAMMLAYQPIRSLATLNMVAYQGAAASKRINTEIDKPIRIRNENHLPDLQIKKSNITFKNVSFRYETTNDKALNNIDLQIDGGKISALVGRSGAGKSTIINLLPRFYDPQEGEIRIDEQDIKKINLNSLRKRISLVSQDVILFDDTIKKNISYADDSATQEEIEEACKFAAADEFIEKLPKKYETIVGENGVKLSGGQKQRISIARAILKKSHIILLDEATSSLDTESERTVQNAINNLIKGRTTIVIAHRLSTIHNANKIFLLENGKITNSGDHDYLIKSSEEYKLLYKNQLK
ncbi:MAG: ABC transporter permease [Candidatus Pelagibacter sp. TMED128]|nr:MAG: ABC transporter permease [Candidatus Pelagibacter sp. TMED128]|tara:strand:+ start:879 stop:2621 length:1743 start_codon:yes stop_codon:yes gene_type:complete